jgi:spermidine synthase
VGTTLRENPGAFDAVLLDVDNGPSALTSSTNARLYDNTGVATALAALRQNGVFAVWSARESRKFEQRLRYCGFTVEVARVRGRLKAGGPRHVILIGHA